MSEARLTETELLAVWEAAAREGRLLLQRCTQCGAAQAYVRSVCAGCQASDLSFAEASGRGTVESFTWVHRRAFEGVAVPYAVARVRLDEGALLLTTIVDAGEGSLACGDPVQLRWRDEEEGAPVPVFAPRARRGR